MTRRRLDTELVRRGLAGSRTAAQRLVADGRVTVGGAPALKPSTLVAPAEAVQVREGPPAWASRAGHKLAGALTDLGVDVDGRHALDAGASTGGFTDVLLARGAARVVAVDVGYGQLRWRLRTDDRVVVMDRTNVRTLRPEHVEPPAPDLVVADLSFISLRLVVPALIAVAARPADLLAMVKPQFEVGRGAVAADGVVREPAQWRTAVEGVAATAELLGAQVRGCVPSRLPGPAGNIEFFLHLRVEGPARAEGSLRAEDLGGPATLPRPSPAAADVIARAVAAGGILASDRGTGHGPSGAHRPTSRRGGEDVRSEPDPSERSRHG